jgi:aminoglycoside phosphotransferase (APT) family kinase protein
VSERIHDEEPDTGEAVVRALLGAACPQWAACPLSYLRTSGTDNAMWRIHVPNRPDLVVRLPRRPGAAERLAAELAVLEALAGLALVPRLTTPVVRHSGEPHEAFPHRWAVLAWLPGADAWSERDTISSEVLAADLADVVGLIGSLRGVPAAPRRAGDRGGPLEPLLARLHRWLDDPQWHAGAFFDVAAARRLAAQGREVAGEVVTAGFVHGDLIPGNVLVDRVGRLAAVIDWGGAGWGDPAQDLAPAWAVLDPAGRAVFRAALGTGDAAWVRGRTFELEHAIGGVLYYVPRRHPLGDVMARTLDRILAEA